MTLGWCTHTCSKINAYMHTYIYIYMCADSYTYWSMCIIYVFVTTYLLGGHQQLCHVDKDLCQQKKRSSSTYKVLPRTMRNHSDIKNRAPRTEARKNKRRKNNKPRKKNSWCAALTNTSTETTCGFTFTVSSLGWNKHSLLKQQVVKKKEKNCPPPRKKKRKATNGTPPKT